MRGPGARQRLQRLLAEWEPRAREGKIDLEDCSTAADRDEIYFLLPLQRNPDPAGGPRRPLFTNEQWAGFRDELAQRFRFRPEMVRVYGEWRNDAGNRALSGGNDALSAKLGDLVFVEASLAARSRVSKLVSP